MLIWSQNRHNKPSLTLNSINKATIQGLTHFRELISERSTRLRRKTAVNPIDAKLIDENE
jgi:hypothetical protein